MASCRRHDRSAACADELVVPFHFVACAVRARSKAGQGILFSQREIEARDTAGHTPGAREANSFRPLECGPEPQFVHMRMLACPQGAEIEAHAERHERTLCRHPVCDKRGQSVERLPEAASMVAQGLRSRLLFFEIEQIVL